MCVPRELAFDMLLFAQRNPKPCPVLDVLEPGATSGPILDGDVRTDLPLYRVWRDGELEADPAAIAVDRVRDVLRGYSRACIPDGVRISL